MKEKNEEGGSRRRTNRGGRLFRKTTREREKNSEPRNRDLRTELIGG